ncbi:MAG: c-type cytochrome biogenesis protein CcmI [Proteobacteria bacterium]|nr:MAG: c-type cytochrome biogenesis protein CcmI [Pseudomonadota bacterium]
MVDFWAGALIMLALAIALLIYPLVRKHPGNLLPDSEKTQTVRIFKDRLAELEAEKAAGLISEDRFTVLKTELEASLVDDVGNEADSGTDSNSTDSNSAESDSTESNSTESNSTESNSTGSNNADSKNTLHSARQKYVFAAALVVFAIAVSGFFYGQYGFYGALQEAREFERLESAGSDHDSVTSIAAMITSLEGKMKDDPTNMDGWFLLGKSYMNIGQYHKAVEAFDRLIPLAEAQGGSPASLYGIKAQALYFASNGRFTEDVKKAIDHALRLNPDETNTLGLLGIMSMQAGQYEAAIQYWSKILELNPEHPGKESIQAGIDEARKRMEATLASRAEATNHSTDAPEAEAVGSEKAVTPVSLNIRVELDSTLAEKVAPSDTLYIYARALKGSKMPLAIVRKSAADLPLQVTLDDSQTMMPSARLSNFDQVEVIARISKQGTPQVNPGDLEGRASPVDTGSGEGKVYSILINQEIPDAEPGQ